MTSRGWPAPAKLNLILHITGRRADGYHDLQTVFQFVDLCDELDFTVRDDGQINRSSDIAGLAAEDDLVVRAAKLLQSCADNKPGVDIHLRKQIPMQGGLGGGSSDAATTLVALNCLWQLNLDEQQLVEIGLKLGADVPVFIHGRACFAEGVGERFQDLEPDQCWYLIVRPDCEISTAELFNDPDLTRNTPPITIRDFLAGAGQNDCQAVAEKRFPQVAEVLEWLGKYCETRMTGTGSCVFGKFGDETAAKEVLDQLPLRWQGMVAKGQNQSPLLERQHKELLGRSQVG